MFRKSSDIQRLADALRPVLGLPERAGGIQTPTMDVARFAAERHRVGPLLHRAWFGQAQKPSEPSDVEAFLAREALRNARRELRQKAAAGKFCSMLDAQDIAFLKVKGWRLGEELYGQSALRHSKDVDILVARDEFDRALKLAAAAGYRLARKSGEVGLKKARRSARHHREVSIIDTELGVEIELHSRLLGYPPTGWRDPALTNGHASIADPDYALYLLVHGATPGWDRLKWLMDLAMLAQRVAPDTRSVVLQRARELGCEEAILAALLFLAELWEESLLGDWLAEIDTPREHPLVRQHTATIVKQLSHDRQMAFPERVAMHVNTSRLAPVFGKHPPATKVLYDRTMLWILGKL